MDPSAHPASSILDHIPVTVTIHDGAGRILYVNDRVESDFGFAVDAVVGQPIDVLLKPNQYDPGQIERIFRRAWTGEAQLAQVWARRAAGSSFPVEISVAPGTFNGERVCVAVLRDVTVRHRLDEQLQRALRMEAVGRLAGGIAHDMNNILAIVRLNAGLVRGDLEHLGGSVEEIDEICIAVERARDLTRQLLAFGRQQVLQPRPLDLNPIVVNIAKMMRRLISADIEIVTELDPAIGCVNVDPSQIDQALMNLIVNAGHAMPNGGRLTIRTRSTHLTEEAAGAYAYPVEPGPYVVLSVADTGCGMDAQTREHVFDPFFTTKPLGSGTGLGLATVYGIVKQSGGYIWLETDPGQGSIFEIYLPRSEAVPVEVEADPDTPAERAPSGRGNGTGEKILLVEDEDAVRRAVRETLRMAGYDVVECADGEEALEQVRGRAPERFDLVLTDLIMPRMGGRALAAELRASGLHSRLLYMSGYTDMAQIRQETPILDAPFIPKPFSPVELLEKIREVLYQPLAVS